MPQENLELLRLRSDINRITETLASNPEFGFEIERPVSLPAEYENVKLNELTMKELTELGEEMRLRTGGEAGACVAVSW
jgi:hypothetical protein